MCASECSQLGVNKTNSLNRRRTHCLRFSLPQGCPCGFLFMKELTEMTIEPYDDDLEDQPIRALHVRKVSSGRPRNKTENAGKLAQHQKNRPVSENLPRFSYQASRHEASWLYESLGEFLENQWIADVLSMIKGGKEAAVYRCVPDPHLHVEALAAKVYRPRLFRSLKNDHVYRQGRSNLDSNGHLIKDDGMLHAIAKKTEYGRELMHSSWIEYEYQNMLLLKDAGADVPRVYAREKNAILMDFIGYAGQPAPLLNDVQLERNEANQLFERVLHNIQIMLENNRVHADLSAYNILYCDGGITLIDFPQTIDPRENNNAAWIFARDIRRVCEYFALQGVRTNPGRLAAEMWNACHFPNVAALDPHYLDENSAADRRAWDRENRA